jgi:sporulation protein YlmC with PRC-barrel domain
VNLDGRVKLVSQVLDLPIIDSDERWCGIVDDIEFRGAPGKGTHVSALLVGPGAYSGRMPRWLYAAVEAIAGNRLVRVPADQVIEIGSVVKLKSRAEKLKLHRTEDKVRACIPRWGAV